MTACAMITGLPISNSALAVQNLATPADRLVIVAVAGATDLTGAQCSTHAVHWQTDTYAASAALVDGMMQKGGNKKWFFITVDYIFGKDIQAQATKQIVAKGGQVLGQVLHPGGNLDFSSAIIAAQQSGADVIGVASGGQDMENTIKAAREFGVTQGRRAAAGAVLPADVAGPVASVRKARKASMTTTWFQPTLNAETMAWTDRFVKRVPAGRVPTALNFGAYSSTMHYLKAVEAAGTDDAKTVMAKMKSMPVDDMVFKGGSIRPDGRVLRDTDSRAGESPEGLQEQVRLLRSARDHSEGARVPPDGGRRLLLREIKNKTRRQTETASPSRAAPFCFSPSSALTAAVITGRAKRGDRGDTRLINARNALIEHGRGTRGAERRRSSERLCPAMTDAMALKPDAPSRSRATASAHR